MFESCTLRNHHLTPARCLAPLAGYTHSAFRRLLAEFGGCGALWTEMLAAPQILREDFSRSPWLKRSPLEPLVVYQLMVRQGDPLEQVLDRFGEEGVGAVDLNLACDAPSIRACEAGSALFNKLDALQSVTQTARRHWPNLLTAKIRLGICQPNWQTGLRDRLRVLEDAGLDAVTVHPRFFEERFRRRARWELLPWIRELTSLPLIANGDFGHREQAERRARDLAPACAVMIGRRAIAQPWIFATWDRQTEVDPGETWRKFVQYVREDFPESTALRRLKMFTRYFASNFAFGHAFRTKIRNATSFADVQQVADRFFAGQPALLPDPVVAGL